MSKVFDENIVQQVVDELHIADWENATIGDVRQKKRHSRPELVHNTPLLPEFPR